MDQKHWWGTLFTFQYSTTSRKRCNNSRILCWQSAWTFSTQPRVVSDAIGLVYIILKGLAYFQYSTTSRKRCNQSNISMWTGLSTTFSTQPRVVSDAISGADYASPTSHQPFSTQPRVVSDAIYYAACQCDNTDRLSVLNHES